MQLGNLNKIGNLSELDIFSVVISAVCHDFGHDGLTNAYHINKISDRAITYSD